MAARPVNVGFFMAFKRRFLFATVMAMLGNKGCEPLHAFLNFGILNCPKKNSNSFNFLAVYSGISEQIKSLQFVGQAAEFKFWVQVRAPACHLTITSEGCSRRQWRFHHKINCWALGAALKHSFGGSGGRVETQGVSESATVAAGRDRLAWEKNATTLAIMK